MYLNRESLIHPDPGQGPDPGVKERITEDLDAGAKWKISWNR